MKQSRSIFDSLMAGIKSVMSAFSFIKQNGMMKAYIWIFVVMILVFVGGVGATFKMRDVVNEWVMDGPWGRMLAEGTLPSWMEPVSGHVMTTIMMIVFLFLSVMISGYVALILLSPLFSYLAQKTYAIVTGKKLESSFKLFVWGIVRGIGISLRNMLFQFLIVLLLFIGTFVPVVGIVCPILIFVVDAFYVGFCMTDYSLELKGMNISESIRFGRQNRALMTGLGFLYSIVLKVPFLGIYFAILVAPACVVGAAVEMFTEEENEMVPERTV